MKVWVCRIQQCVSGGYSNWDIINSFMIRTVHQLLLGWSHQREGQTKFAVRTRRCSEVWTGSFRVVQYYSWCRHVKYTKRELPQVVKSFDSNPASTHFEFQQRYRIFYLKFLVVSFRPANQMPRQYNSDRPPTNFTTLIITFNYLIYFSQFQVLRTSLSK